MRFDGGPRGDTELLRGCVHECIHLLYDRVLQTTSQNQERVDVYILHVYIQSNCAVRFFLRRISLKLLDSAKMYLLHGFRYFIEFSNISEK